MGSEPFILFKRKDSKFCQVRFKDGSGGYGMTISTKKTDIEEAKKVAWEIYNNGQATKNGVVSLPALKMAKNCTHEEMIHCLEYWKRQGELERYILPKTKPAIDFVEFLTNFWDYDNSPYVKEKLRKKHSIHRQYCTLMLGDVKAKWIPYFQGRLLGEITKEDIDAFIDECLEPFPTSSSRKNFILSAGVFALRWAYKKDYIEKDVTKGILFFSAQPKERQILSPEIANILFNVEWNNEKAKLANMLASVTGLRAGEIQALQVQDIGQDCLYIKHSWNEYDKLKAPKNNKTRIVQLPFPDIIQNLLILASKNPHGARPDSFVFWSEKVNKPADKDIFIRGLRSALLKTGMSKEAASVYVFHSWRHFYTSYMKGKVEDSLLQRQTGHKSLKMLKHYADHILPEDKEKIQEAQREVFGHLVGVF